MPEWSTIWLFLAAVAVLVVIPGPTMLYIVTRGVHQGRSAGVVSALGVETATLIHVAAATLGLSAILASSAVAFSVVKYAGAAYLRYLGVRTLLSREQPRRRAALSARGERPALQAGRAYRRAACAATRRRAS